MVFKKKNLTLSHLQQMAGILPLDILFFEINANMEILLVSLETG